MKPHMPAILSVRLFTVACSPGLSTRSMRAPRWLQTESVKFIAKIATVKLETDYINLF